MISINTKEFFVLKEYLLKSCGIDVPDEKQYLFTTRLSKFLEEQHCSGFSEFYIHLTTDQSLQHQFVDAMTTNETSFFRDKHPFQTLVEFIIPHIVKYKLISGTKKIYIWSVGCSTGQEPYSIAMSICDYCRYQKSVSPADFIIFASDISQRVINKARQGVYTDEEVGRGITDVYKTLYFKPYSKTEWQILEEIRNMVQFTVINLSKPIPSTTGTFDLIMCRNVLIYFSLQLRQTIIHQLHSMLHPEGIFFIGSSETLYCVSEEFIPQYYKETIYHKKK